MSKTSKVVRVLMVIVIVYTISPLFATKKLQVQRQLATRTENGSETADAPGNIVTETFKEVSQKIESSLGSSSKCSAPFRYAIGAVDPRFGIGKDELKADMLKAESTWEKAAGMDILAYDEQSEFKVNLVFDDRQKATLKSKQLEEKLSDVQSLQKGISKEYDALSSQYDKKKAQYESDAKKYQTLSDEYEKQVAYWNAKGGAPEAEYERLQQRKKDANALVDDLEKQRQSLNDTVSRMNALAKKEKNAISGYNKDVATYESKYGGDKAFDQGVYTGKEINIYQFGETGDLVLVLAHELGHALGMDHVENPKSIMYYLMAKQDIDHPAPSAEDLSALKNRCSGV